jgi:raffinose/stachyose/melibiose transport system permease protein
VASAQAVVIRRARFRLVPFLITLILTAGGILSLYPIYFTVISALKSRLAYAQNHMSFPAAPTLENFGEAFHRLNIGRLFLNSLITTAGGVLLTTAVCFLAAYAITKLRFPGKNFIFLVIIATLLIPNQTIMYPLYQTLFDMRLVNEYSGLIVTYAAFGLPLGTYLLAAYFKSVPDDLIEAAIIDGANHLQIAWRVMLPVSRPAVATLGILNAVWMWNDLLLPLLILPDPDKKTLMVGIALFQGQYDIYIPLISAGLIIGMLPIIVMYLFGQAQLIKGMTAGAVR